MWQCQRQRRRLHLGCALYFAFGHLVEQSLCCARAVVSAQTAKGQQRQSSCVVDRLIERTVHPTALGASSDAPTSVAGVHRRGVTTRAEKNKTNKKTKPKHKTPVPLRKQHGAQSHRSCDNVRRDSTSGGCFWRLRKSARAGAVAARHGATQRGRNWRQTTHRCACHVRRPVWRVAAPLRRQQNILSRRISVRGGAVHATE